MAIKLAQALVMSPEEFERFCLSNNKKLAEAYDSD